MLRTTTLLIVLLLAEARRRFTKKGWFVMTRFTFRTLAIGTLAFLMFAGHAASQTASPGAVDPTDAELKMLAAQAATPADHRALQEYFLTLEKRYMSDAKNHSAIARRYRGTRIAQAADHCERIVANARASAKEANAAAALHAQLASLAR
jgi:hypothetical protein